MTAATLNPSTALREADRCDRCGARAYVRVTLATGGELLFCSHHAKQHEQKLRAVARDYHDETSRVG